MTESLYVDLIEPRPETEARGETDQRKGPAAPFRGAGVTGAIRPDEFRAELACGAQAGVEDELVGPYEQGFAAFAAGKGLLDNPYPGDSCAHQQWANGWSQARDEAQRQAR